jgi:hypothetical protein
MAKPLKTFLFATVYFCAPCTCFEEALLRLTFETLFLALYLLGAANVAIILLVEI